jgi:hypothetical protein
MPSRDCHRAFWAVSDPCGELPELRGDSSLGECVVAADSLTAYLVSALVLGSWGVSMPACKLPLSMHSCKHALPPSHTQALAAVYGHALTVCEWDISSVSLRRL